MKKNKIIKEKEEETNSTLIRIVKQMNYTLNESHKLFQNIDNYNELRNVSNMNSLNYRFIRY